MRSLSGQKFDREPLGVTWIHGSPPGERNEDPAVQVHWHDEHTVLLRQNKAVHYEAPFSYLLFGARRAVLIDTGATPAPERFPVRQVVDALIGEWLALHPRDGYGLLVLHSHSHDDHVAGDGQFRGRRSTVVVGADRDAAWGYLGFTEQPESMRPIDLGERVLQALATPGHDAAAITYYDPWTGFLLTGDTVYRGRLYISDWTAFRRTIDRLVDFAAHRDVTHVLGCHIEMTRQPGTDYPVGTTYQPDEPRLEMRPGHLLAVRAALAAVGTGPARYADRDFILWPVG
jgi:glyoxylase-like metal-dependent hydrolase (beta-lactamase superfamily II)